MNSFSVHRALHRLRRRAGYNLRLGIRLVAGFTLLLAALALADSADQTRLDPRYADARVKRVSISVINGEYQRERPLDAGELRLLRAQYPDTALETVGVGDMAVGDGEDFHLTRFILCPSALLPRMGEAAALDAVEARQVTDAIDRGTAPKDIAPLLRQAVGEERAFRLIPSPLARNMLERRYAETAYTGPVYLFQVDGDWHQPGMEGITVGSYALFQNETSEAINRTAGAIHHTLSSLYPDARVTLWDSDEKVARSVKTASNIGMQLAGLAALLLTVALVGMLGAYLIACDQRLREFGILLEMGVSRASLTLEMALENGVLFGGSALVSCLVGGLVIRLVQYPGMALRLRPGLAAGMLGLSVLLSTGMAAVGVSKLNSVKGE